MSPDHQETAYIPISFFSDVAWAVFPAKLVFVFGYPALLCLAPGLASAVETHR